MVVNPINIDKLNIINGRLKFDFEELRELNKVYRLTSNLIEKLLRKYKKLELIDKNGKTVGLLELSAEQDTVLPSEVVIDNWIRDRRTEEQFLKDLIKAWFMEDLFGEWLRLHLSKEEPSVTITGAGADKERKIVLGPVPRKKVTTEPDFIIRTKTREIKIELQYSNTKRNNYDIKDSKINRAVNEGDVKIIFIIKDTNEYFIIDPYKVKNTRKPLPNPRWGGKPVYTIKSNEITYYRIIDGISFSHFFT